MCAVLELIDACPDFDVLESEYHRLLGFPKEYEATGRVLQLTEWARQWYGDHGRPWWYARQADNIAFTRGGVSVEGTTFASRRMRDLLHRAGAESVFLVAVSAGGECERHTRRVWAEGKPDEYFFLEVFGSAVVEALVAACSYHLCEFAEDRGTAILPHYSPGYPGWDISDQQKLLDRVVAGTDYAFRDQLRVLQTGMLQPKKSLLAVFGVTPHVERVQRLTSLVPCENCSLSRCRYRRAPYRWPLPQIDGVIRTQVGIDV